MTQRGTLLIVDDEKSILNAVKRIFVPLKYEVFTAQSGKEGLSILENNAIDLIISDMRMPEMDGATFLKTAAQKWPETRRLLLTGHSELNSAISAINEGKIDFYIHKPWDNEFFVKIVNEVLEIKFLRERNQELQNLLVTQNDELRSLNNNLEEKVDERTGQLRKAYESLETVYDCAIEVFISIVDLYEAPFSNYARTIASHAKQLAHQFNLPEEEVRNIYLSAMLHGIGKLHLPQTLKSKPIKTMTKSEFEEFVQYPALGAQAFTPFKLLDEVAECILNHRERFDGTGYPQGLSGTAIPLSSRILSIVIDYYDLQHGLVYPTKMSPTDARNHLMDHQQHYDPEVFSIFLNTLAQTDVDMENSHMTGIRANAAKPHLKPEA